MSLPKPLCQLAVLFAGAALSVTAAHARELQPPGTVGDPDEYAKTQHATRAIYRQIAEVPVAERIFLLSRADILELGDVAGGEYRGDPVDGRIRWMLADVVTGSGRYQAEFFLEDGAAIYVYETMTFYEDGAPAPVTRNFKGLPYWERRTALDGDRIVYSRTAGTGAPQAGTDAALLQERSRSLLDALQPAIE